MLKSVGELIDLFKNGKCPYCQSNFTYEIKQDHEVSGQCPNGMYQFYMTGKVICFKYFDRSLASFDFRGNDEHFLSVVHELIYSNLCISCGDLRNKCTCFNCLERVYE